MYESEARARNAKIRCVLIQICAHCSVQCALPGIRSRIGWYSNYAMVLHRFTVEQGDGDVTLDCGFETPRRRMKLEFSRDQTVLFFLSSMEASSQGLGAQTQLTWRLMMLKLDRPHV